MLIRDGIHWMLVSLLSQKQRSFLTALGIAIGIFSVTLLTSVGEGLRLYLLDTFSTFGTRLVTITAGKSSTHGLEGLLKTVRPLTEYDVNELRKLPFIEAITPLIQGTAKVEYHNKQRNTELMGVGEEAVKAWRYEVATGRFLPNDDASLARPYAVLGSTVKHELFGSENPLGKIVRVGGQRFRVIGTMKSKGQMLGFDLDDVVYVPSSRAGQILNREGLSQISLMFSGKTTSTEMAERVKKRLIYLHGKEDFTLQTQEDMLDSLDKILRIITLSIASLGTVSLLVGGVGIATIMTTTLHERMSEIGLLRAIGATRQQTLLLFLGEATLLASMGGIAGIVIAIGLVNLLQTVSPQLPLALQPFYLMGALCLSTLIGLIAGILPAWKASLLNPISALRQ